jgi:hypothetical protein
VAPADSMRCNSHFTQKSVKIEASEARKFRNEPVPAHKLQDINHSGSLARGNLLAFGRKCVNGWAKTAGREVRRAQNDPRAGSAKSLGLTEVLPGW